MDHVGKVLAASTKAVNLDEDEEEVKGGGGYQGLHLAEEELVVL